MVKAHTTMKDSEIAAGGEAALRACLEEVPFLRVEAVTRDARAGAHPLDLLVEVSMPGGRQLLVVEVKRSGQPRLARAAINSLARYHAGRPDAYGIFLAPYISPASAALCQREGIGYIDLAGNCLLTFDQVFIKREGRPNRFAERRELRSLYSPKAERLVRVLLTHPSRRWKLRELAEEAEVSIGLVHNVKELLADREWIDVGDVGFQLTQPRELLADWSRSYRYPRHRLGAYYRRGEVPEIEAELAEACAREGIRYALTGFSGAARLAPYARYERVTAYVDGDVEKLVDLLGAKRVTSGANLHLLLPYDEGVFYGRQEVGGSYVASAVQVYLDLAALRGRGEDAAEFLLDQVIRTQW